MKDENKPFNDVIDHFNKIEGNAANLAKTIKILWVLYDWFHLIIRSLNDYFKFIKLTDIDIYSPAANFGGFFLLS
ncbi:hypothetical protein [Bacillus salipaludis]|uniref:Uncharacterized protein n=1 Tax=Bacillus salipaludis TaxID=2547811 RepID=A0ABW8RMI3_9BACI